MDADTESRDSKSWDLRSYYYCGLAFLLGVLHFWAVSLVGQMPVAELLVLFLLGQTALMVALNLCLPPVPSPKLLFFFCLTAVVSLVSYIISDLYRESLPVDMVRGWLRVLFILTDILGFAILLGAEPRAFAWRQLGFGFSFVMVFLVPPLFGDYWKFTFGFPVTVLVVMAFPYIFRRAGVLASIVSLASIGGLHMLLGFRNAGGSCFVVAGLLTLRYLPLRPRQALMLVGFLAIVIASPRMVAHTFTSKSARANRSNIERAAMLQAAWEGFARSPLIGQGSWFSKSNVTDIFMDIRRENSMENAGSIGFDDVDVVTIHSQILMSLAEGGLFGGAFFFFYGLGLLWAIWYTLGEAPWSWLLPMRLFLFVANFWDILMSPFSGPARLNIALVTVLIAVCWEERQLARRSAVQEPVYFNHLPLPPPA